MIEFILNNMPVRTELPVGSTLLDLIRYHQDLPGTKIGCREGDCGACTVLEGQLKDDELHYRTVVSCLTPLGNAHGKHIVTVEGLNMDKLSPVQQAMVDHNGTQCGFCTPGFVVSLTGHTMQQEASSPEHAIDSVNGNICRCTGYKSIERAAISISGMLKDKNPADPLPWLISNGFLPEYFTGIKQRLLEIHKKSAMVFEGKQVIGGGTDLMVQKPDSVAEASLDMLFDREALKGVDEKDDHIVIGAAATANDIMHAPLLEQYLPAIKKHYKLISSDPIRNMGTIGGNIVNASPIADLVIYFLALDASLRLKQNDKERTLPLRKFFLDYKKLDLREGEYIAQVAFRVPVSNTLLNFEKVSKRTHLDIASVNSAMSVRMEKDVIAECHVAAGGVSPVPKYLAACSSFLQGKPLEASVVKEAAAILQEEITPISDVRGSKAYKRLLARQLFFAHFIKLFPEKFSLNQLTS